MDFMQARDEGFGEDEGFVPSRVKQKKVYEPQVSSSWSYGPPVAASVSEHEDEKLDHMETTHRNVEVVEPMRDVPLVEMEHMFDKVVTPSDVGKLNRLVIPKQYAEKYFPLDSSTNEKGLLLNFDDRQGKPWRFRYSYWNSSQSYVMTKGWSRFVKEKKLDAGDIVSFQRGVGEAGKDRLFIDWRRRSNVPGPPSFPGGFPVLPGHFSFHRAAAGPWSPLILHPGGSRDHLQLNSTNYGSHWHRYGGRGGDGNNGGGYGCRYGYGSIVNLNQCEGHLNSVYNIEPQQMGDIANGNAGLGSCNSGGNYERVVLNSVPFVQGKAAAKRLRLFGVNMECPLSESDEQDLVLSSTSISHVQNHPPQHYNPLHQQQHSLPFPNSSSVFQHPLQPRLYDDTPPQSATSTPTADFSNEGKSRSMSLDLDI